MKTSELSGTALDWAVFSLEREASSWYVNDNGCFMAEEGEISWAYQPSTDWRKGGAIIEREKLGFWWATPFTDEYGDTYGNHWYAEGVASISEGETPLIAAMRCYVASKLGGEVEVPNELGGQR